MLQADAPVSDRLALHTRNALKIGFFGPNCSSGIAATKVPERWSGSWDDNLRLARMLDDAGIEFLLPVARWKGHGGETNFESSTFETITWACGLLAQTLRLTVFGTVHAPLVHPVFAAKQFVTADHIGRGRFGLNVVCGWNQDEFDMFGAEQREHDARYAYGAEWLAIVRDLWSRDEPFDHHGEFFHLRALEALPKPYAGSRPAVMNAGASPAGKAFAVHHADHLFTPLRTLEQGAADAADLRERARRENRAVGVFTNIHIVCRPTRDEAAAYYHWFADECADWAAVDHMTDVGTKHASTSYQRENVDKMRVRFAAGYGGYPVIGDPDAVARELAQISAAGFTGFAAGLVNYLDEFPYIRDEVLPRLERLGLREPHPPTP